MLARPLGGMLLVIYVIELARTKEAVRPVLWVFVVLSFLVAFQALATTQWTEKSADFLFIIELIPDTDPLRLNIMAAIPQIAPYLSGFGFIQGGFNPNEIGGVITWLAPFMFGVMAYPRDGEKPHILRWSAGIVLFMLLLALTLGQSRASIIGVLIALTALTLTVVPKGVWRNVSLVGVILLTMLQASVFLNVFPAIGPGADSNAIAEAGLSARDERTTSQRFDIWESALNMVQDYPLTGVGMARFRYTPVRNDYPVSNFDFPANPNQVDFQRRVIPHAHNEFVQIATDLGLPGLLIFVIWNILAAYMVIICWIKGTETVKLLALSAGAAVAAHFVYGMGDAIPIWDRFSFVYWMLLGVIVVAYRQLRFQ